MMKQVSQIIQTQDGEHSSKSEEIQYKFSGDYDLKILARERELYNSASYPPTDFDCPICLNKKNMMILEDGYNVLKDCKCKVNHDIKRNMEKSGLLEVFRNYNFDNFDTTKEHHKKMKQLAESYIKDFDSNKGWMFIGGSVGVGKTMIASATFLELLKKGYVGEYKKWHEIVREIKADVNSKQAIQIIYELSTYDLLYIDDFLKNFTQSDLGIAFNIIQGRADRNLPTIITSELYIQEINEMDQAISSRIKQKCKNHIMNIKRDESKNYRLEEIK